MKILIAGASGVIGSAVNRLLISRGHEVIRLVRKEKGDGELYWDPDAGEINIADLEGFNGVVHVASMPWPMRWTPKFKKAMYANRISTNSLLAKSLAGCKRKPRVIVCASGMGFYPSSGDQIITEDSDGGTSFLANLQRDGEAITKSASEAGIRVVHLRIPPVLVKAGIRRGAIQVGHGRQWMSWVGRDELANIVLHILTNDTLIGPINPVSPNPVRNVEFALTVARVLGHKKVSRMPGFILRLLLGEAAQELMFASRRIEPRKLLATGYQFRFPKLEAALCYELGVDA